MNNIIQFPDKFKTVSRLTQDEANNFKVVFESGLKNWQLLNDETKYSLHKTLLEFACEALDYAMYQRDSAE